MSIKTTVTGGNKLKNLVKKKTLLNNKLRAAVLTGANMVANDARRAVAKGPKSGIVYKKYSPKRIHVASKEGEAPATDLGFLLQSIKVVTPKNNHIYALVVASAEYAAWLEFGTKNMGKRPFLGPAFDKNKATIKQLIKDATTETLKGG